MAGLWIRLDHDWLKDPKVRTFRKEAGKAGLVDLVQLYIGLSRNKGRIDMSDYGQAADLADTLVPRLGALNMSILFDDADPRWVAEVVVKRGDSATRIAQEHGSTLASMARLNGWANADRLAVGARVKVMNHPKFNIVVHKKLRAVDLFLGGKLFKRYEIPEYEAGVKWPPGDYKTPANLRDFLGKMGAALRSGDLAEISMLVPRDTPLNITAS